MTATGEGKRRKASMEDKIMRPFIRLGDRTSHGGTVVEGSPFSLIHGNPVAHVGNKVTCPKCGDTIIVTGDPSMTIDGHPVARDGDQTACGAILIASQITTGTNTKATASADMPAAPKPMQPSGKLINFLTKTEKVRLKPYSDASGKNIEHWEPGATIGIGHLISSGEWSKYKNGITQEQAGALFKFDLQPKIDAVNNGLARPVSQNQFDALVMLCYNTGEPAFLNSSVLKLVNNPSAHTPYQSLDEAWRAFDKSQGAFNQGLLNRRNAELAIYHDGTYKSW